MYIAQQKLIHTDSFYVYLGVLLYQPKHMQNRLLQCKVVAQQHHSTYSAQSVSTSYVKTKHSPITKQNNMETAVARIIKNTHFVGGINQCNAW